MCLVHTLTDENTARRQFEEAVSLAMRHAGVNYSEALEIVLTPARQQGGKSVADYVRRGQIAQARKALADILDDWRELGSSEKPAARGRRRA